MSFSGGSNIQCLFEGRLNPYAIKSTRCLLYICCSNEVGPTCGDDKNSQGEFDCSSARAFHLPLGAGNAFSGICEHTCVSEFHSSFASKFAETLAANVRSPPAVLEIGQHCAENSCSQICSMNQDVQKFCNSFSSLYSAKSFPFVSSPRRL